MKKTAHLLVVTLVVVLLGARAASLRAAPAQQGNLLQNPGFEQPFSGGAAGNWQTWSRSTPRSDDACLVAYHVLPKWNVETAAGFVREGTASQYVGNNWDTWSGGVYQTVAATPGTTYRFSFYGRGRGSNESAPPAPLRSSCRAAPTLASPAPARASRHARSTSGRCASAIPSGRW